MVKSLLWLLLWFRKLKRRNYGNLTYDSLSAVKSSPCQTHLILFKVEYGIRIFLIYMQNVIMNKVQNFTNRQQQPNITQENLNLLLQTLQKKLYSISFLSNSISFFGGAEIFGVRFRELTTAESTISVIAPGSI